MRVLLSLVPVSAGLFLATSPATAQSPSSLSFGPSEVVQLSVIAGIIGAAFVCAIWLIKQKNKLDRRNRELGRRLIDLNVQLQRSNALLNLTGERILIWSNDQDRPELLGSMQDHSEIPEELSGMLAFSRWLTASSATSVERAITTLRAQGIAFELISETLSGTLLRVKGYKPMSQAFVRFEVLGDDREEIERLRQSNEELSTAQEGLFRALDLLPLPLWLRDADLRLRWVNTAYLKMVDAKDKTSVLHQDVELLGQQARSMIERSHLERGIFAEKLNAVVSGDRRVLQVTDIRTVSGSIGSAEDITEVENLRGQILDAQRSHSETLDQLTTAIAIFDNDRRLRFYNQAFQELWALSDSYLASSPDHVLLLDRLREEGKLPEQPKWAGWKDELMEAYRSSGSIEHWWHLPDRRTIRVVANPQPKGGVTWIFENVTERIDLESRYNTAMRVQNETLDNLAEGVAVFGPDGWLRLSNPAFEKLWRIDLSGYEEAPHISELRKMCDDAAIESPWEDFVSLVTGLSDERVDRHGNVELHSGTILRHAVIHLPNGQMMLTFVDVTDSERVTRALADKNEALEKADRLKNDFVQHVSYELRSPLTNIIGFTELLAMPDTGVLNERQREYLQHIGSSSSVLLTVVNDILDLATVDAGIMQLEIGEVEVETVLTATAEIISDRLREHAIELRLDYKDAPASFEGDEQRVRQVLFNLLLNASNYAPENSVVTLGCRRVTSQIEFWVRDLGPGIPVDIMDSVFNRFEPRVHGGRRRGAGLGLSIVKSLVELHGGAVAIDTGEDRGTTVYCRFPLSATSSRAAAE
ncbi:sensor histidine kinase [Limoniibacter endophyticus]|uniref:histidine kinase n=1 Tax=Limoniibacter endophyticus TaxID=1565040 RepID=A0A8J3GHX4_9HYPH|nr:PAS domain-containing sensor histidine kinase [Limoniibacter endophyticus]GHC74566.1 alkaline phosphatase [Limoniibacter endophyticus]